MSPPFARLLVANRGEIAVRVIRACRELGIVSIAVYSDADRDALHVEMADVAEHIGPAVASASYLNVEAVVAAARRSGADAIHPGYGLLSENAAFATAVAAAGMTFVGPAPETIALLGDKLAARRTAAAARVPIVPGTLLPLDGEGWRAAGAEVGFPALLKAAAGGGGRGMRRVTDEEELRSAMPLAAAEATAAFGDGTLYLERLIGDARHVEVQLLGDRHGHLAVLGERDCSVQRRHQKLVEEAPAPGLTERQRQAILDSARRLADGIGFHSVATAEFLVDADGEHYFLEMNTRLQVEHGVTELVTGLDLVAWQIRVAAGEPLPDGVLAATARGHAIEVRIYAEDPFDGFQPAAGTIGTWRMPFGPGVRVDAGVRSGSALPPEYDPLLAKVMVHAEDRRAALDRLRGALDEALVGGVPTGLPFFGWLLDEPGFVAGRHTTDLVAAGWGSGPPLSDLDAGLAALVAMQARTSGASHPVAAARPATPDRAWATQARAEAVQVRTPQADGRGWRRGRR